MMQILWKTAVLAEGKDLITFRNSDHFDFNISILGVNRQPVVVLRKPFILVANTNDEIVVFCSLGNLNHEATVLAFFTTIIENYFEGFSTNVSGFYEDVIAFSDIDWEWFKIETLGNFGLDDNCFINNISNGVYFDRSL